MERLKWLVYLQVIDRWTEDLSSCYSNQWTSWDESRTTSYFSRTMMCWLEGIIRPAIVTELHLMTQRGAATREQQILEATLVVQRKH